MGTTHELTGLDLRYVLTRIVSLQGPLSVAELRMRLRHLGFSVAGRPSKTISDALRWEVRRGRVERRGRGFYGPGDIPRSTEYRIIKRVQVLRFQAQMHSDDADFDTAVRDRFHGEPFVDW